MDNQKRQLILAIESSADETSAAVIENGNRILSLSTATQIASHRRFGGIVPEVASRHHLEWINLVIDHALQEAKITNPKQQLSAVAATYGPGLVGSLLVGLMAGKTLALTYDLPFIGVNHLIGHLQAAIFNQEIKYPALGLLVSGGHTQMVWIKSPNQFQLIGQTLDDAAGEAFDKIGRVLNLDYPAGQKLAELSSQGTANISLPKVVTSNPYDFSFSGLKSAMINYLHTSEQNNQAIIVADCAASFQKAVVEEIIERVQLVLADQKFKNAQQFLLGGGVAANQLLREQLSDLLVKRSISFNPTPIKLTGDNAAMIGAAAQLKLNKNQFDNLDLNAEPRLNFVEISQSL